MIAAKRSHVKFTCTNEQQENLERELKATGIVVGIKTSLCNDEATVIEQNNPQSDSHLPKVIPDQHENLPLKGMNHKKIP